MRTATRSISITLVSTLLAAVFGFGLFSATPVFAAEGGSCASLNGSSQLHLWAGSSNGLFQLTVGDQVGVTVSIDKTGGWMVSLGSVSSGFQLGNGSFNFTAEFTGPNQLKVSTEMLPPYQATFSFTCVPAGAPVPVFVPAEPDTFAPPAPEIWQGAFNSTIGNYDGRIDATKADRYAVYCMAGELQVWDGVEGTKVGFASYETIAALANPVSVAIGENVYLGRSNNVLGVVIPGSYEMLTIALDKCLDSGYDIDR